MAHAQYQLPLGKLDVEINATVGDFYLSVSGYISPYASVVLYGENDTILRSGVADAGGNFFISQVLIRRGFSGFCLLAVDFRQLGQSKTCIAIPPATGNVTMTDIFLPPTVGISRAQIGIGDSAQVFGYTMPGATVIIHVSNGVILTTTADSAGYYELLVPSLPTGTFDIYATATYQGIDSLSPSSRVQVLVLSLTGQGLSWLAKLWKQIMQLLTSIGWLWLLLLLIALIIYLIYKLWPEKFAFLTKYLHKRKPEARLHDWWWVGY